jgi:predicted dithiol-disulfide oxidoreductase (DUF899 family)
MATEHQVVSREAWDAARKELLEAEEAHDKQRQALTKQRRELPWTKVEKAYTFATDQGPKTLLELFEGRSQLIAYHVMFGPDYEAACPGCTGLADGIDPGVIHLNHLDVTVICISRAPIERLTAYKQRMGWHFPYVSSYGTNYPFDFGFAQTAEQMTSGELAKMIDDPPGWLRDWSDQVGAPLAKALVETPGWIVFAREGDSVYLTYRTDSTSSPLLATFFQPILDIAPKEQSAEPRAVRKDEYDEPA